MIRDKLSEMEVISLQSGSAGNSIFVKSGETCLLIDAGITGSTAENRLFQHGHDIRDCNALLVTHEHSDHISGVGVIHRKFGLPIFATQKTWNATRAKPSTGIISSPNFIWPGKSFRIGSLKIEPIRTPHDAIESVCFVIEDLDTGKRFGILTDLGHVFSGLKEIVASLDAVLIESNYDEAMLRNGPYPQRLKDRIVGKRGHISNGESASLLASCGHHQLQWVCLGHLSKENNTPEIALETHRSQIKDHYPILCAPRDASLKLPSIGVPQFSLK